MSSRVLLVTDQLTKRYRALTALDHCSLSVAAGEVFGLLGPNGAGKTTLLRILLGFLRPTAGSARIAGFDCATASLDVRKQTAYLPGDARLFRQLRGHDVLRLLSRLRGARDVAAGIAIAERLRLELSRRVSQMSTGMRQKLALSATLAADVPLIILDEPTSNLDPTARGEVLTLVREAKAAGRTVIFSSHIFAEVEAVCDRVAVLRDGRVTQTQVVAELRRRHRITARLHGPFAGIPPILSEHLTLLAASDGRFRLEANQISSELLGWLATLPLDELSIEPLGLETVYETSGDVAGGHG